MKVHRYSRWDGRQEEFSLDVRRALDAMSDLLMEGLDEIRGLREAATRLAGGGSPECLASAIEFILEGLHLANQLNKTTTESGARYARS